MRPRRQRAFSLIELVVALGLLAMGLIGVVRLFPVGLRASKRSEVVSKATFLAQQRLEEVRLLGYAAIAAQAPSFPLSGAVDKYQWTMTIQPVQADGLSAESPLRAVIVTVQWPEGRDTRSTALATYVTE